MNNIRDIQAIVVWTGDHGVSWVAAHLLTIHHLGFETKSVLAEAYSADGSYGTIYTSSSKAAAVGSVDNACFMRV